MKLAFWSSAKENAGVTSNMACISIVAALGYSYKAILFENHYQKNDIGRMIKYHHADLLNSINHSHVKVMGIDYIMKNLSFFQFFYLSKNPYYYNYKSEIQPCILNDSVYKTNLNYKNLAVLMKDAALEIVEKYLYYLPTNAAIPQNIYDFAMYEHVKSILEGAEELADIVYVDTTKDNHLSTKIILNEVDLVVVNLNQSLVEMKHFFQNYSSLMEKCVFLISNYNPNSFLTIQKISHIFTISQSKIAGIPYNDDYREALIRGTLVEFLYRNIDCGCHDPIYPFINEVENAVTMILMELIKKGGVNETKA